MIFVTVGTHEQQFNRLVEYIDKMKKGGQLEEEVIIQTGFSSYEPQSCKWNKLFSYQEMVKNVEHARIVITHGGPSSFIMPLQIGKIPVVVPRQKQFNEHVNNHQLDFCKAVEARQGNIIVLEDIDMLADVILNYESIVTKMSANVISNNSKFNEDLEHIVNKLFTERNLI